MEKRRRLANKMTIMVCAVLIAVSAFFYIPMGAHAQELVVVDDRVFDSDVNFSANGTAGYSKTCRINLGNVTLSDCFNGSVEIDDSSLYEVELYSYISLNHPNQVYWNSNVLRLGNDFQLFYYSQQANSTHLGDSAFRTFVMSGEQFKMTYSLSFMSSLFSYSDFSGSVTGEVFVEVQSVDLLSDAQSSEYQNGYTEGYNIGLAHGEGIGFDVGYDNGYEFGYDDGFEEGLEEGYDEGFQAGKDSVNTQLYYDKGYDIGYSEGYEVGYNEGYDEGFDAGYDNGYDAAMSEMEKWGADTNTYPLNVSNRTASMSEAIFVDWSEPRDVECFKYIYDWIRIDPTHTYKFVLSLNNFHAYRNPSKDYLFEYGIGTYFQIGGFKYPIPSDGDNCEIYVSGDRMSTSYGCGVILYGLNTSVDSEAEVSVSFDELSISVYDMGPSGNTQNHIANQTDKLNENADKNTDTMTNGFDNSKGNKVNSDLSSGLDEYQTAEDSLWATATTGLNDFTFFDIQSVPAMVTGISFVTATMTGWFNNAGGASGVGIVLSILFSVMLVAMVLGLYRWYQSKGGKD